jgi:hypothetical protein
MAEGAERGEGATIPIAVLKHRVYRYTLTVSAFRFVAEVGTNHVMPDGLPSRHGGWSRWERLSTWGA